LPDDGVLIVNTQDSPGDLRRKHGIEAARIYTLDATKIAFDEIGRPIPNTPMVGALVKITGILGLDGVIEVLKEEFKPKFNESIIEGNLKAVRRAYEEVRGE